MMMKAFLNRYGSREKIYPYRCHPCFLKQTRRWKTSAAQDYGKNGEASTIDTGNVKFFSDKVKVWWDPTGPVVGLHGLNKLRVPFIVNGLTLQNKDCGDKKILDIGCGGGILTEAIVRSGFKVTGLDASDELIGIAREHSELDTSLKDKPSYICTTIEDHVQNYSNYYDGVIASEVIEHVNNKELFIRACIQALKPGGRIFFTAPNKTILSLFINLWAAEYVFNALPKGTHSYDMLISADDLKTLLMKYNCDIERSQGCFFNLFTRKWHTTTSVQLFFMLQAVKRI